MYLNRLWIFFWDKPFLSRLYEIYLSIKDLENWAEFNLLQNLHLCTQESVCARNFGPLGEIGANFSLQLTSRTQLAKINNKKVIAENQCEKHKKSSLVFKILEHLPYDPPSTVSVHKGCTLSYTRAITVIIFFWILSKINNKISTSLPHIKAVVLLAYEIVREVPVCVMDWWLDKQDQALRL